MILPDIARQPWVSKPAMGVSLGVASAGGIKPNYSRAGCITSCFTPHGHHHAQVYESALHFISRSLVQDASHLASHLMITIMHRCANVLCTFSHDFSFKMFHILLHTS